MKSHTGTGTVRIWRDESDYTLCSIGELDSLPPMGDGVFVLISDSSVLGKVIVLIGKLSGRRSAAEDIKKLLARKELDFYQANRVALRSLDNAAAAEAERDRLEGTYLPMVELVSIE